MSRPANCVGCTFGDHERHNPEEGHTSGIIGGYHCSCKGDCAERHAKTSELIAAQLGSSPKPPSSTVPG